MRYTSLEIFTAKGKKLSLFSDRALKLLRIIEATEEISQRELAKQVKVSLGTANHVIRELIGDGILESVEVTTSKGKRGATYHLTEYGQKQRGTLVLQRKKEILAEINSLQKELDLLSAESN